MFSTLGCLIIETVRARVMCWEYDDGRAGSALRGGFVWHGRDFSSVGGVATLAGDLHGAHCVFVMS